MIEYEHKQISIVTLDTLHEHMNGKPLDYNGQISQYLPIANYPRHPANYLNMAHVTDHKQLPFCILTRNTNNNNSNSNVNANVNSKYAYSNYKVVVMDDRYYKTTSNPIKYMQRITKHILNACQQLSIIVFDYQLGEHSLSKLNNIYQNTRTWLTYFNGPNAVQAKGIHSMYWTLLAKFNQLDFGNTNRQALTQHCHMNKLNQITLDQQTARTNTIQWIYTAFLQLTHSHAYPIKPPIEIKIYQRGLLWTKLTHTQHHLPLPAYQPLLSLSQAGPISIQAQIQGLSAMLSIGIPTLLQLQGLSQQSVWMALEDQSLPYLPLQHSLHNRATVKQGRHSNGSNMCVISFMQNMGQHRQYKKILDSILSQDYQHSLIKLVVVDGRSSDLTTQLAHAYLSKRKHNIEYQMVRDQLQVGHTGMVKHIVSNSICSNSMGQQPIIVILQQHIKILNTHTLQFINLAFQDNCIGLAYSAYLGAHYYLGHSSHMYRQARSYPLKQCHHFVGGLVAVRQSVLALAFNQLHKMRINDQLPYTSCFFNNFISYLLQTAAYDSIYYIPKLLTKSTHKTYIFDCQLKNSKCSSLLEQSHYFNKKYAKSK